MLQRMNNLKFSPERLREARGTHSMEEIAAAVGVTRQTIGNWEAGTGEPPATALAAIAALTGHALGFFFVAA